MGWTIQGSNPGGAMDFSLLQNVHTGSGAQPATYLIGAAGSFSGGGGGQSGGVFEH